MSGRGETDQEPESPERASTSLGQPLFTADGRKVGTVRGIETRGVFVETRGGIESLSVGHARSGHSFGEAELMWRCTTCGEMGTLDTDLPQTCPNCDAAREELMYWTED